MRNNRMAALAAGAVLMVGANLTAAAPAVAAPPQTIPYSDSFDEVAEDFCGIEGFDVNVSGVAEGVLKIRERRGAEYWSDHGTLTEIFTVDGVSVTAVTTTLFHDLHIEQVGDTLVITYFGTGNATVYGPDGKAIGRNPGQVRFQVTIDTATGEELDFQVLKESTGRSDDLCDTVVPVLQG